MGKLPYADNLSVDLHKLADYCLDPAHPRGKHKARVFRDALGIGQGDAAWLRDQILAGAAQSEAFALSFDEFGRRWRVDLPVKHRAKSATIRTVWILRSGETTVRFVTCWVL